MESYFCVRALNDFDKRGIKKGQKCIVTSTLGDSTYALLDKTGYFPASYFEPLPVYFAIGKSTPAIEQRLMRFHRLTTEGSWERIVYTTPVEFIYKIGIDYYMVITENTVYLYKKN